MSKASRPAYTATSLLAHSLTNGTRVLVSYDIVDGVWRLGHAGNAIGAGLVRAIRITGQRMRVFLWSGRMIYCGINDKAVVVL